MPKQVSKEELCTKNLYKNQRKYENEQFIYAGPANSFKTDRERVFVVVDGDVYYIPNCTKLIIDSSKCHDVVFSRQNNNYRG